MSQPRNIHRLLAVVAVVGLLASVAIIALTLRKAPQQEKSLQTRWQLNPTPTYPPKRIMGTSQFELWVVAPGSADRRKQMIAQARAAARSAEAAMNVYDPASPLSRFNVAPAEEQIDLPPDALTVLQQSWDIWQASQGAFDVTIRPLLLLWKGRDHTDELPAAQAIATARQASRWDDIELLDGGASKTAPTAAVDLGGIAKGYGIDQAAEALMRSGASAGLVNIGGDVRTFGQRPNNRPWRIGIRSPFDPNPSKTWMVVAVANAAICTSGNYERFTEIDGKRYSHIIDPRTGWPAEASPSVTVIAPTASLADAWATALSVLGPEGLELLEGTGIEAMIVLGRPEEYRFEFTNGFAKYVADPPPGWPAKASTASIP